MGYKGMHFKWGGCVIEGGVPEALPDVMALRLPNGLTRRVSAAEFPPSTEVWLQGLEDPPPIIAEYP